MDLAEQYDSLKTAPAQQRGRLLPVLVRRLLEQDGYNANLQARAAAPRDADIFASRDGDAYLIEVKASSRSAGISQVDELVGRLRRTAPYVVGVLVSRAGFATSASAQVAGNRDRLVLLVDDTELRGLFRGELTPHALLRAKQAALVRNAEVRFYGQRSPLELPGPGERQPLPDPGLVFPKAPDPFTSRWVVSSGENHDSVFVDEIPDANWTAAMGSGTGIDIDIRMHTVDELAGVCELLRRANFFTSSGRFAIHQIGFSWHGAGMATLIELLRCQADRYAALGNVSLHSEEHAVYFDRFRGGRYTIVLRVVTLRKPAQEPWIMDAQLSLQLLGIPLDTTPLRLALRSLGLEDDAFFRCLGPRDRVETVHFRLGDVPLVVQDELVAVDALRVEDETWVSGIVAENPFRSSARQSLLPEFARPVFADLDIIVCSLGSWYPTDARPDRFYLKRVDSAWTASAQVVVAAADWEMPASRTPGSIDLPLSV